MGGTGFDAAEHFDARLWQVQRLLSHNDVEQARVESALLASDAERAQAHWVVPQLEELWRTDKVNRRSA